MPNALLHHSEIELIKSKVTTLKSAAVNRLKAAYIFTKHRVYGYLGIEEDSFCFMGLHFIKAWVDLPKQKQIAHLST